MTRLHQVVLAGSKLKEGVTVKRLVVVVGRLMATADIRVGGRRCAESCCRGGDLP